MIAAGGSCAAENKMVIRGDLVGCNGVGGNLGF